MLPKGLGNMGNIAGMMKQAMELKGKIEEVKEELGRETVEASAGGGMVTVVMNGRCEVLDIKIEPEIIDRDDPETLTTLIRAAMNEGVRMVQEKIKERMSEMTGGLDIPGLTS